MKTDDWEIAFEKLRISRVVVYDEDDDTYIHDESPEYLKDFIRKEIAAAYDRGYETARAGL